MRTLLGLVVLGSASLLLGACGGDSGDSTCQLRGEVSGAVSWKSSAQDPACLIPFAFSSGGLEMDYRPLQESISQFDVEVPGIKKDLTGPFPAQVKVRVQDGRSWSTAANACTVTVDKNVFVMDETMGKRYQLDGRGECTGTAMPSSTATGTVTIAPFTFRFPPRFL